jgi:hypothetical protein
VTDSIGRRRVIAADADERDAVAIVVPVEPIGRRQLRTSVVWANGARAVHSALGFFDT